MSLTNQYKKKEKLVEAIQIDEENIHMLAVWCGGYVCEESELRDKGGVLWAYPYIGLDLKVNGIIVRANIGDYVYRDHKGLFKTMTFERFMRKYVQKRDIRKIPSGTS